jgi:hypothetical protein
MKLKFWHDKRRRALRPLDHKTAELAPHIMGEPSCLIWGHTGRLLRGYSYSAGTKPTCTTCRLRFAGGLATSTSMADRVPANSVGRAGSWAVT